MFLRLRAAKKIFESTKCNLCIWSNERPYCDKDKPIWNDVRRVPKQVEKKTIKHVDLTSSYYKDDEGDYWEMPSVQLARTILQRNPFTETKYMRSYHDVVLELLCGKEHVRVQSKQVFST